MDMGSLDQQQLLDIASEMVKDNETRMPDYLTPNEEKAVKELIKTLRAANLAMKTYIQQCTYNDALRKQIELHQRALAKWNSASKSLSQLTAARKQSDAMMSQISKSITSGQLKLTKSQMTAASNLNDKIDILSNKLDRLFKHHNIPVAGNLRKDVCNLNLERDLHHYFNHPDIERKVEGRLNLMYEKLSETNPELSNGIKTICNKMHEAQNELVATYGQPSSNLQEYILNQSEIAINQFSASSKQFKEANNELAKQEAVVEEQRRKTTLMGKWYIVAAIGDALMELGQNLMC